MRYYTYDELASLVTEISERLEGDGYLPEGMYRVYAKAFTHYWKLLNLALENGWTDSEWLFEAPSITHKGRKWSFK